MKFVATECPEHCELINHSAVLAIFTTQFPLKVIAYKHQELTNQHSQHRGYELTFLAQRLRTNIHSIHKLLIVEYYLLSTIYDTTVLSMTISRHLRFLLIRSSFPLEKEPKWNSRNAA